MRNGNVTCYNEDYFNQNLLKRNHKNYSVHCTDNKINRNNFVQLILVPNNVSFNFDDFKGFGKFLQYRVLGITN